MKRRLLLLLTQFASVFLLSLIGYLLRPIPLIHTIFIYALIPLLSAFGACVLVTKGINPYLTWFLPPLGMTAAAYLSTLGISQSALPMMITSFVSLIGAATGDTILKTGKRVKNEKKH